ncbi:MAG: hypothetical protein EHM54_05560 [Nitrospiraceae bacterium]|nr:MAG: hypothetical protein EHM54_05560 [Nitrospiraceae bacterium]
MSNTFSIFHSDTHPQIAQSGADQMVFLGARGCRCIGHDRRGHHGPPGQPTPTPPSSDAKTGHPKK